MNSGVGSITMSRKIEKSVRIGKQPLRYRYILNPYSDVRCTVCPGCQGKTRLRKVPLVIHLEPGFPLVLNKTCRYCPHCDILIAHHDELEPLLLAALGARRDKLSPEDYLVLGTFDRADWRAGAKGQLMVADLAEKLHDFTGYLDLKVEGGWGPAKR
jgi:hypothetical protein